MLQFILLGSGAGQPFKNGKTKPRPDVSDSSDWLVAAIGFLAYSLGQPPPEVGGSIVCGVRLFFWQTIGSSCPEW